MPSAEGRALSLQQQYALELIAEKAGDVAEQMMRQFAADPDSQSVDRFVAGYEALLLGALAAVVAARTGYLSRFAVAEGQAALALPAKVLAASPVDVLVDGLQPKGAVYSVLQRMSTMSASPAQIVDAAVAGIRDYAESTVTAATDYVDSEVLGPVRTIVALRRVAHPTACDRCQRASQVLVFKHAPALRHPQCRCSFEPVYVTDDDYQIRLERYRRNAAAMPGSRIPGMTSQFGVMNAQFARDVRSRGRRQLERAEFREQSVWLQDEWRAFLTDEQRRLGQMVSTVRSNTYRDWAVMTSVKQAEIGGDLLPVLTRK